MEQGTVSLAVKQLIADKVLMFSESEDIEHVYATKELKSHVIGRLFFEDINARLLEKYVIPSDVREQIEDMEDALRQLTNVPNKIEWESHTKTKDEDIQIECDLYLEMNGIEDESKFSVKTLLSDVGDIAEFINSDDDDVKFKNGDWLWMEIAENVEPFKVNMMQLERSYRFFKGRGFIPACFVLSLNGDRAKFTLALEHVQQLYKNKNLQGWQILNPVFLS